MHHHQNTTNLGRIMFGSLFPSSDLVLGIGSHGNLITQGVETGEWHHRLSTPQQARSEPLP